MGRGGYAGLGRWAGLAAVALLAVTAGGADAQRRDRDPAGYAGVSLIGGSPLGAMGDLVDGAIGAEFYGAIPIDPTGHLRLRGDLGFLVYGHERMRLCYAVPVGCRIEMDLNTTNSIFFGGLGPELVLARGDVEPYVNASFGFSYFSTMSSLSGESDYEDYFNTTNFSDAVFAWKAGAGVRVRVSGGRSPVSIDLGVERHENGVAEYLTKGDIEDHADGSITLYPNRTEANLMTFRLGVSVAIPRGGDDEGGRRERRGRRGR